MQRQHNALVDTWWAPAFKRVFDLLVALLALALLWPVLLVIALLVRLFHGSPVFFRQQRPGRGNRLFGILKFRTMTDKRDANGKLLPDAERLTPLGSLLRRSSLDELPELLNVLRGEMSLVGPRPLLPEYLPWYTEEESIRHAVRPGLTGWAQVNGRNFTPWNQRLALDVWYVKNWSPWLDMKILLVTVMKVLGCADVAVDATELEGQLDHERSRAAGAVPPGLPEAGEDPLQSAMGKAFTTGDTANTG